MQRASGRRQSLPPTGSPREGRVDIYRPSSLPPVGQRPTAPAYPLNSLFYPPTLSLRYSVFSPSSLTSHLLLPYHFSLPLFLPLYFYTPSVVLGYPLLRPNPETTRVASPRNNQSPGKIPWSRAESFEHGTPRTPVIAKWKPPLSLLNHTAARAENRLPPWTWYPLPHLYKLYT